MEGHSLDDNLFPELDPTHCFNGHNLSPPHHQQNHHHQHHNNSSGHQTLIPIDNNGQSQQDSSTHPSNKLFINHNDGSSLVPKMANSGGAAAPFHSIQVKLIAIKYCPY